MSEHWEEAIQKWYTESHTANLEYLDLSSSSKVSSNHLAHNLSVIYDKTCLSSRVHIKNLKLLLEKTEALESRVGKLEASITTLTTVLLENRPQKLASTSSGETKSTLHSLDTKIQRIEETLKRIEQWTST